MRAQNPVISENELLEYEIYYAFVTGAKMTLDTETVTENGKKLYHLVAKGNTIGFVDKIYHIMEDYESWADPQTLLPDHALKNVRERETRKRLNQYLAQNSGQPIEVIERDTERDHWMSAEEALAYGLVDQVVTSR